MSFDMSQQAELSPRRSAVSRWFLFADNTAHLQPVNQSFADPLESFLRNVAQAGIDECRQDSRLVDLFGVV